MCTIILFITQPAEASISGDLENGSFYSANGALTGLVTTDLVHSLFWLQIVECTSPLSYQQYGLEVMRLMFIFCTGKDKLEQLSCPCIDSPSCSSKCDQAQSDCQGDCTQVPNQSECFHQCASASQQCRAAPTYATDCSPQVTFQGARNPILTIDRTGTIVLFFRRFLTGASLSVKRLSCQLNSVVFIMQEMVRDSSITGNIHQVRGEPHMHQSHPARRNM